MKNIITFSSGLLLLFASFICQSNQLKTADNLPSYLTRDIQDEIFYFVLPDRFYNGDKSNDLGNKNIPLSYGGFDPTHKGMFHGGDIKGLQEKIPYLKNLGITAIWLTPILRNQAMQGVDAGYHGYWVLDFTEIDPHLGSNQDLQNFIEAAHQQNIKVFFDIIVNHTADVIKFTECHGEDGVLAENALQPKCAYKSLADLESGDKYTPYVPKAKQNSKVPAWLNDPIYYHNQGDTDFTGENSLYGDFMGLDDVNTDDPRVVNGMIDIFKNIVKEFKPDGFRIDTVRHVNMEFWQAFSPAILDYAKAIGIPQFFMFGEVYDPDPAALSQFTTTGKLQSVLDFGFQDAVFQSLVENKGTDVFANLFAKDYLYQDSDSNASQLLTFTGNHDMGRFGYMLNSSKNNYNEEEKIQRFLLAHALMYFARGIPVIYYGDEQGFNGDGNDQDARQDMMPSKVASYNDDNLFATNKTTADDNFDPNHLFYKTLKKYSDLYLTYPALRHGEQNILFSDNKPGLLVFSREVEQEKLLILLNTSSQTAIKQIKLEDYADKKINPIYLSSSTNSLEAQGQMLTVSLAPLSVSLVKVQ